MAHSLIYLNIKKQKLQVSNINVDLLLQFNKNRLENKTSSIKEEIMLREKINNALKEAMKAREEKRVLTLRLINAAIKDRDIVARGKGEEDGVNDEAILQLLQSMIKQRLDSIELYQKGNRQDLVDSENKEIEIIKSFLPRQLEAEEVIKAVAATIEKLEAKSIKDMGKVMAELRKDYAGQMDFAKASNLIKEKLAVA